MLIVTVKGLALSQLIDKGKLSVIRGITCPVGTGVVKTPIGEVWVTFSPTTAGAGAKRPHSKTNYALSGKPIKAEILDRLLKEATQ